jgi:mRNA interferase MazF
MVIAQGEIWWAELPLPIGSAPGFRRPVVIVQGDAFNRSRIRTVVCVPVTSNLRLAEMPGNVRLTMAVSSLPKDSVANVSAIVAIDRTLLQERVSKLSPAKLALILAGIDVVLGRGFERPAQRRR